MNISFSLSDIAIVMCNFYPEYWAVYDFFLFLEMTCSQLSKDFWGQKCNNFLIYVWPRMKCASSLNKIAIYCLLFKHQIDVSTEGIVNDQLASAVVWSVSLVWMSMSMSKSKIWHNVPWKDTSSRERRDILGILATPQTELLKQFLTFCLDIDIISTKCWDLLFILSGHRTTDGFYEEPLLRVRNILGEVGILAITKFKFYQDSYLSLSKSRTLSTRLPWPPYFHLQ